VTTTVLGFYDLDASPQRGITSVLAERLGAATRDSEFVHGALYVRSDHSAIAISLQHNSSDVAWLERPLVAGLMQGAAFRSRTSDVRSYTTVAAGTGAPIPDEAVFTIQRFDVAGAAQTQLSDALQIFVRDFAQPISGFLDSEILASQDGARVIWMAPWGHEAALAAIETAPSFAAMRGFEKFWQQRDFAIFDRVSYVRADSEGDA
jgi:hypothetical protein